MTDTSNPGPCSGLRVVEFATMVSGPFAGQMLGDLGAEVIKIEAINGDPMRVTMPQKKGQSAYFSLYNRNKKSIALDLKSSEGKALALELSLTADIIIENFRPDVMDRLGLGYETLKHLNPKLIYLSLSGFGLDGPYAARAAYDHVIQGMSGLMPIMGSKEDPTPVRAIIVDKVASVMASNATLAALLYRERHNGEGQKVSVSLLDSYAAFVLPDILNNHYFQSEDVERIRNINIHHPVATKDGHIIGHLQLNSQFEGACRIFGREDLITDPRFTSPWARLSNYEAMWAELSQGAKNITTDEVMAGAEKYSVPLGRVNDIEMFFKEPQVIHNKSFFDVEDEEFGTLRQHGFFARFEKSPAAYRYRAPKLGEHTDEILHGLGKSDAEIAAAREHKAVR